MISTTIYSQQEPDNSQNNSTDTLTFDEQTRATPPNKPAIINFLTPLVFNPNLTPNPTQPARIANVSDLLVYIAGATENGPFGSPQSTNYQINAINNTNIGVNLETAADATTSTQANANQIVSPNQAIMNQIAANQTATNPSTISTLTTTTPPTNSQNQSTTQLTAQGNALVAVGIAASGQVGGVPTSTIQAQNAINQQAAFASATSNASQAASQIRPNQPSSATPNAAAVAAAAQALANQNAIANPNPFITINNPPSEPKIVTWNAPLIIDHANVFFNTQSVVKFEENIIYNPGAGYTFPTPYVDYPAAIIIARDNITIDLAGFNLSMAPRSAAPFLFNRPTYGISILPGVKNTRIISSTTSDKPGSISGFSGYAIYGSGENISFTYSIYANMIRNLVIDNILMNSDLGGIHLENALHVTINDSAIIYSFGARDINGIFLNNVFNSTITSINISQNYSHSAVVGINLIDTIGIIIDGCIIDNNRSILDGDAIGILVDATTIETSHNNKIQNCNISGNHCASIRGKEAIGIAIRHGSYGNGIENCSIFEQTSGVAPGGVIDPALLPISYGIKLELTANNQILKNQVGYNGNFGIYESAVAPTYVPVPAPIYWTVSPSTPVLTTSPSTLYTNNTCLFHINNYYVSVSTAAFPFYGPLPTTILYPGDLTAYTGGGPILQNLEVKNP